MVFRRKRNRFPLCGLCELLFKLFFLICVVIIGSRV